MTFDFAKASASPVVVGGNNPNYKVHLICASRGLNIAADMPEQLTLAMQSEWENRFGASTALGGAIMGDAGSTAARWLGANTMIQEFTRQIWSSTSPLEIPLQLIFDAEESALAEVYKPIMSLMALTVPIKSSQYILTAPGPSNNTLDAAVSVRIGRMLFIPDGIATSVQAQFDGRLHSDGFPIAGQVDITIRTSQVYSNVEWDAAINSAVNGA